MFKAYPCKSIYYWVDTRLIIFVLEHVPYTDKARKFSTVKIVVVNCNWVVLKTHKRKVTINHGIIATTVKAILRPILSLKCNCILPFLYCKNYWRCFFGLDLLDMWKKNQHNTLALLRTNYKLEKLIEKSVFVLEAYQSKHKKVIVFNY